MLTKGHSDQRVYLATFRVTCIADDKHLVKNQVETSFPRRSISDYVQIDLRLICVA